jgi:hypothetical protein
MTPVFGRTTVLRSLLFGGFAPSVIGRSWHMSARDYLIQAVSLLLVEFLTLPSVANNMSF